MISRLTPNTGTLIAVSESCIDVIFRCTRFHNCCRFLLSVFAQLIQLNLSHLVPVYSTLTITESKHSYRQGQPPYSKYRYINSCQRELYQRLFVILNVLLLWLFFPFFTRLIRVNLAHQASVYQKL